MPRKTVRKSVRKYIRRGRKSKTMRRSRGIKPFKAIVGVNRNTQIYNKKGNAIHYYKDTIQYTNITGTSPTTPLSGLVQFDMGMLPRYATLASTYRQFKVHSLRLIFRLRTIELTDNASHPYMLLRYNYDPTLTIGSVSENFLLRQNNVVSKQFIHNTPEGTTLEYYIKPCTMQALKQWNSSGFIPSPKFNQWVDFASSSTNETALYGLVYFLQDLPSDQTIDFDIQFSYSCRDII